MGAFVNKTLRFHALRSLFQDTRSPRNILLDSRTHGFSLISWVFEKLKSVIVGHFSKAVNTSNESLFNLNLVGLAKTGA